MKKRLTAAIALTLFLLLSGCGNDKIDDKQNKPDEKQDVTVVSPEQVENTDINPEVEIEKPDVNVPLYVNPLSGLPCERDLTEVRPVAIMLNNLYEALPQVGISEAEIVYEVLEEGGITRLLGIYNDFYLMEEIGSVRSARDYYIDIADAHDAVYVHAGRSTYADTALKQRRTNNIDGLYSGVFYRSNERLQTKAYEHTLMTTGYGLYNEIANKGYRNTSKNQSPLVFGEDYQKGIETAKHIEFPFTIGYNRNPYITASFDYDESSGLYLKSQFSQPHVDGDDGEQLSFKNVITLTCPMNLIAGDPLGCIQVHFTGTGKGTYSVDGTIREITWKKSDRNSAYTLYEEDGAELVLSPGKSYIALVCTGTEIKTN